ncbi:MAG: hypothetical protein GX776_05165, partial [Oxalobacter sp.]|nr:hypothetical protein [Oxalobacter sp.]
MPANDFTIVKNESGAIAKFRFTEQGKYNFVRWFNTNANPVEASIDFFEEEILIELHGMYRENTPQESVYFKLLDIFTKSGKNEFYAPSPGDIEGITYDN